MAQDVEGISVLLRFKNEPETDDLLEQASLVEAELQVGPDRLPTLT